MVNTQSTVDNMIAAPQVVPSIPLSFPSMRIMLPTGMPNMAMQTTVTARSSVTIRRTGSISSGSTSSLRSENRYSRPSRRIFPRSARARENQIGRAHV